MNFQKFEDEDPNKKNIKSTQFQLAQNQKNNQPQQQQIQNQDKAHHSRWLTDAYDSFKARLSYQYIISDDLNISFDQIAKSLKLIPGNSTAQSQDLMKFFCCFLGAPLVLPLAYYCSRTVFEVERNCFAFVIVNTDQGKKTQLYGPGYHVLGLYTKLDGVYSFKNQRKNYEIFESSIGDLKIAVVSQGTIMHLEFGGQNIILGPGIHKIVDPMVFRQIVSLDSFYIEIGPEKWVTIPDGYDGISINRGQIQILKGGKQHHLPHVGDKFVKIVPLTLQTDKVPTDIATYVKRVEMGVEAVHGNVIDPSEHLTTTTAEGANITLDAMIFWKIIDTELASKSAMEILKVQPDQQVQGNIKNHDEAIQAAGKNIGVLRQTILRIAKNYLTALVGTCSLAGKKSIQAEFNQNLEQDQNQQSQQLQQKPGLQGQQQQLQQNSNNNIEQLQMQNQQFQQNQQNQNTFQILQFLQSQTVSLKDVINEEFNKLGCELENVCIYSVIPNRDIQQELDKQTKAKVDANTAVINALSKQQAANIEQQLQLNIEIQNAENQIKVKQMNQKIDNELQMQTAETQAKVLATQSKAQAQAQIVKAQGEQEAIITIAKGRQEEAQKLQNNPVATQLAMIRVVGESGERIFKGDANKFVFGQNPGDFLYQMVESFQQRRQTR